MRYKSSLPGDWADLPASEFVAKWYDEQYNSCTYCNAAGFSQKFMHRSIETKLDRSNHFDSVLEIGANRGEHLPFVKHTFNTYFITDIQEYDRSVLPDHELRSGIIFQRENAMELSFKSRTFDRVLCSCVLHHVNNAEAVLMELRRVLKSGGTANLFLSSDPGFLFRLGRYIGPVREAKKLGLSEVKRLVDARDHRNHVAGLIRLVRHVFRDDEITELSYPIRYTTWNFNLWRIFNIIKSDKN